jgi:dihydroflavonol-4-reductase
MTSRVLVSGATGFIASHAIEKLLAKNYEVVSTVRNPADASKNGHLTKMTNAGSHLKLVAADLNEADPFTAHADADFIFHMASPYALKVSDPQRDLVDPAVNGTLSMMRAAAANKRVKRVVLTSSMAAITDEPDGRVLTEEDWNTQSTLTRNAYYLSKTMAERAAWDFMKSNKPHFDLVVINPFLVIGPAHTSAINTSNQTLVDLINGTYPAIMALNWGFVDVRDVADAHIAAMETKSASGRYICAAGNMDMGEVVSLIRANGYQNSKLPKMSLTGGFGTSLMKLASYAQPAGIGSYLRTHLGRIPRFSNDKIKRELGINFMTPEDSIKDTLKDLARWGHIPQPSSEKQAA